MDTSRRLVEKTLAFDAPARIPRNPWVLAWAGIHYPNELARINQRFPSDIATAPACLRDPLTVQGIDTELGSYTDEWGCTFINIQRGVIGEVKQPLIRPGTTLRKCVFPLKGSASMSPRSTPSAAPATSLCSPEPARARSSACSSCAAARTSTWTWPRNPPNCLPCAIWCTTSSCAKWSCGPAPRSMRST